MNSFGRRESRGDAVDSRSFHAYTLSPAADVPGLLGPRRARRPTSAGEPRRRSAARRRSAERPDGGVILVRREADGRVLAP
ncbi:hypothetical protein FHR81_002107 [Actinoalloteichus hoggarensis]|uniref:hypothetical protein n=1 Tax=Actinoalloteichus hoggarensis TaxID=1470176 RepID=UPI0012FE049C|nr:hypothetical protein [Actinoalloteichus hoggarensis]MBB5921069.1 hypothetical protein [Actinoalloteichus hoggarensis]